MASDGYLDAGYEYVIIDDCWMAESRDQDGRLQPNADRFPDGIRPLADYIHNLGLKFGIYLDYGTKTCAGYPGSRDSLELDANTLADWTVDYLKMDGCNVEIENMEQGSDFFEYYEQFLDLVLFFRIRKHVAILKRNWPSRFVFLQFSSV